MKEVRRGILLAKNDYKAITFEAKHHDSAEPIVADMMEIYDATEKIIMGDGEHTALTIEAYCRTMDTLRGREPLPD